MKKNQDTIEGLLHCLDKAISWRDKKYEILDLEYQNKEGYVLRKEYDEYKYRKEVINDRFSKEVVDYQEKLDELCRIIRTKQPSLMELKSNSINTRGIFPRNIALGKLHVEYNNLDFFVPQVFKFPFEQSMYICDKSKIVLFHKVILRLLYALPIDKQEYYVFDPINLGKSVNEFNVLFSEEKLFPNKKVLHTKEELKDVLKNITSYILELNTKIFNIKTDCLEWDTYNRRLYSQREMQKMLPYKIFIFIDVPNGMDQECFEMFKNLIRHGKQCGILVLFSFNKDILKNKDLSNKIKMELEQCIKNSVQLHTFLENDDIEAKFYNLKIKQVGEKFPNIYELSNLLYEIKYIVGNKKSQSISFEGLMKYDNMFDKDSIYGLDIPVGYGVSGNSNIEIKINDETAHYLIGGNSGSGKSNFLHNLIVSASCGYSPDELRIYLLDFKDGVEFNQYTKPILNHANLIAIEADAEYGITVLRHLLKEQQRRYETFKSCEDMSIRNIQEYRKRYTTEKMPRILVIIDEFQALFNNSTKIQSTEILEKLAKQGRACGIHFILATQSLNGLDISTISNQFNGRIALKCFKEDSNRLLGNEEAAEIKIPYAIVNTSQGNISGNTKFMVPKAEGKLIFESIKLINNKCEEEGIVTKTKIYEGEKFPIRCINKTKLSSVNLDLQLGEILDYDTRVFNILLRPSLGNNVLIIGHNEYIKKNLLESVIISSKESVVCDEIIYIGKNFNVVDDEIGNNIICLESLNELYMKYEDSIYDKRRVLIIDNCNLIKEINWPIYTSININKNDKEAYFLSEYFKNANEKGSYIIGFYEGTNLVKEYGIPSNEFTYKIGYSLNSSEKNSILCSEEYSGKVIKNDRAFLVENSIFKTLFKPYVNRS